MPPQVSIIIPVYSRAAVIQRALESVAAQTFDDYDIVVVDDGSTDETAAVVEAAGIKNLTLLRHPDNRGGGCRSQYWHQSCVRQIFSVSRF